MTKNDKNTQKKDVILIILSCFSALFLLKIVTPSSIENIDKVGGGFQEANALRGQDFLCGISETECINRHLDNLEINAEGGSLLLLGNSQMGAINQFKDGDQSYAQIIGNHQDSPSFKLIAIWMPNASIGEFDAVYSAISRCGAEPRFLAIPVFLDDTRESSIRKDVSNLGSRICTNEHALKDKHSAPQESATKGQLSTRLSKMITKKLPIVSDLPQVNVQFRVFLYLLRNTVFGIRPSSKRKIVTSSYEASLSSLRALIGKRRQFGMKTLVYIPPLLYAASNPSAIPYLEDEYESFKDTISSLCRRPFCIFRNFEDVVPDAEWGAKVSTSLGKGVSELDFMHFTGVAHQRFGNRLFLEMKANFKD